MMEFLYFPQNKLEYIPAFITLIIFLFGAFIAMRAIKRASKKEEEKMKGFTGFSDSGNDQTEEENKQH